MVVGCYSSLSLDSRAGEHNSGDRPTEKEQLTLRYCHLALHDTDKIDKFTCVDMI